MKLGCCGSEDRFDAIQQAGYDYIEPPVPVLRANMPETDFEPVRRYFQNASIKPEAFNIFVPADMRITGESVDFHGLTRHVETVMERASKLGTKIIVFGSGGARNVPDHFSRSRAFEQLGTFCAMIADQAHNRGITVVIEPLYSEKCNLITSVAEGAALIRDVNQPGLALLADLFHMEEDKEPWQNLVDAIHLLHHIHVPVPSLDILISEGPEFSHHTFLKTLQNSGYDGRISVEDNSKRFVHFESEAEPVGKYVRNLWQEIGSES